MPSMPMPYEGSTYSDFSPLRACVRTSGCALPRTFFCRPSGSAARSRVAASLPMGLSRCSALACAEVSTSRMEKRTCRSCNHRSRVVVQHVPRQGGVGPHGVAAVRRSLDRAQHGDGGRLVKKRRIGVPAGAEHHGRPVVRFLDERLHLAKARHAVGVGVLGKCAKSLAERMLFGMSDLLVAEIDHLVAEQCVLDFGELRVA